MENKLKTIQGIYQSSEPHMVGDGFRVFNYFSGSSPLVKEVSPFILLDYNAPYLFPSSSAHLKGVGAHPHRGFETVTLVYEGALAHRDSTGSGGVIKAGDVQWMTAGSGILHEEFHEATFAKFGGTLHAIQLWVNLPSKQKMSTPKYQTLLSQVIPIVSIDTEGSQLRVIAGDFQGTKGPATTFTPVQMYDVRLKKNGEMNFEFPTDHNSLLLVTKGSFTVNNTSANFKDLVLFGHHGEKISLKAHEDSMAFVLSGTPIDEPVVSSGPFVMNTEQEIVKAYQDYRSGKFGSL